MIVRDRPSGYKLFLLLRGSVLPRILPTLIINIVVATLVTISHGDLFDLKITLTTIPFTLIGLLFGHSESSSPRNASLTVLPTVQSEK